MPLNFQQIHACNLSANLAEESQARVKDPLWFLARQWQAGEFEAESGGRPVQVAITSRQWLLKNTSTAPLESVVEAESQGDLCPAWRPNALSHAFELQIEGHLLKASAYDGHQMDWHDFDLDKLTQGQVSTAEVIRRIAPTALYVPGAPHPSWWRLEDADAYFDSPVDPEPSVLSVLLPEFSNLDADNWHVVPLPVQVGCVDEITRLTVVDTFGITTDARPAISHSDVSAGPDQKFDIFSLTSDSISGPAIGGNKLFLPHVAGSILENDTLEEVYFMRDEGGNLVWAWERLDQEARQDVLNENGEGYRLMGSLLPSYIPYLPRQITASSPQMILRRGRTTEDASKPQYQTNIVKQSIVVNEEAISPLGTVVKRQNKAALGTDGKAVFWCGYQTRPATSPTAPDIRFDYTSEK
jgi:hypothetical protein